MNNTEQHVEETIEEHEGLIKTPKQLIVTIILAFLVPVIVIVMLVNLVESTVQAGAGSTAQSEESIASRIKPVAGFKLVDANAPKVFQTGQQVFETTCAACHSTGVAGAPKLGDNATWAPLIASGYDKLVEIAIHGKGAMPPKGGNASLSDYEVERAVVYMANESGASFDEPKEPAAENAAAIEQPAAATAAAPAAAPAPQAAAPAAEAPAPAAQEAAAPAPAADTAAVDPAGKKVYESVCFACHTSGIAGAPKLGDKAAWAKFIDTGMDTMLQNAIRGVGAMPPRGGSQASDEEIKAAIEYMVQAVH
ncbi:cytochrome c5 family protein [Alcaligenaceae bacterium]|nr:cytochrome c5 family protein [Alcaligenaceae bacterium]